MRRWQYILHRTVVTMKWINLCEHVAPCLAYNKRSKMLTLIAVLYVGVIIVYSQLSSYWLYTINGPTLIFTVGIIRLPISRGSVIGQLWNIVQMEGKSLSLCPAWCGQCFCCRLGASAIMPPPQPAHFFDQGHSFLSLEHHPVLEGLLLPFIKVTLNSHHYLSKC